MWSGSSALTSLLPRQNQGRQGSGGSSGTFFFSPEPPDFTAQLPVEPEPSAFPFRQGLPNCPFLEGSEQVPLGQPAEVAAGLTQAGTPWPGQEGREAQEQSLALWSENPSREAGAQDLLNTASPTTRPRAQGATGGHGQSRATKKGCRPQSSCTGDLSNLSERDRWSEFYLTQCN